MAFKIKWTKLAEKSFNDIIDYIETNWSEQSAQKFVQKTHKLLILVAENPNMFQESKSLDVRKGLISEQTSVYYRIKNNTIQIIVFWDNRRNPKSLKL